jgi:PAS domain S-box-containing protein
MASLQLNDPELLRSVVENLDCAVYLVDCEKKIVFWNHGAERLSGYLGLEMLGRPYPEDLVVHCDAQRGGHALDRCLLSEVMRDGQAKEGEAFLLHRHGHRIPVRARAFPLRDSRGSIVGAAETLQEQSNEDAELTVPKGVTYHAHGLLGLSEYEQTAARFSEHLKFSITRQLCFGILCIQVRELEKHAARNGRPIVETILRTVGHELRRALHPGDFVGYWKQNRFLAIVETVTAAELNGAAQRLQRLVGLSTVSWWGDKVAVRTCISGTMLRPGDSPESMAERVELALDACAQAQEDCLLVP